MSLCQLKFPSDIGTGSTQYRYVTFTIGQTQESSKDKLTDAISSQISKTASNVKKIATAGLNALGETGQTISNVLGNITSGVFGTSNVSTEGAIMLPLPNAMEDNQAHKWEEQEGILSKLSKVAFSAGDSAIKAIPGLSSLDMNAETALAYAMTTTNHRQFMANPSYWQMYKGTSPRDLNMSWIFVPRTSAEASSIQNIVLAFKKYSSPEKSTDGYMFASPYIWTVSFSNPKITKMLALNNLVCTQVQVSYGDGTMPLFKDGMPKYIQMTLSFHECTVSTANDYQDGSGSGGSSSSSSSLGSSSESSSSGSSSGSGSSSKPSSGSSSSSTVANRYKS